MGRGTHSFCDEEEGNGFLILRKKKKKKSLSLALGFGVRCQDQHVGGYNYLSEGVSEELARAGFGPL